MEKLKGYRTILVVILNVILAAVSSVSEIVNIPSWYFMYVVPGILGVLRFLTDSAVGVKTAEETVKIKAADPTNVRRKKKNLN